MMETNTLAAILNKESILKTANAKEFLQASHDVEQRYSLYASTHVPLGDTTKQLQNLRRVVIDNKTCAVGAIVGPYGYGKTSTAIHLWHELRQQQIMAVPPFLWKNLEDLINGVYCWVHHEFEQGPRAFIPELENALAKHSLRSEVELKTQIGSDLFESLRDNGRLNLDIKPEDVIGFYSDAAIICEKAGYRGLVIFTDELQATLADYRPSRDTFFAHLFQLVKDIQDLPGHWALIISMDDDTEGIITRLRADIQGRMQRSALFFRVKDQYDRRGYPSDLWASYEKQFGFQGSKVILPETLDALGQIASRSDLGAGPRMVTIALSLGTKHFLQKNEPYSPVDLIDDFLHDKVLFDKQGKLASTVRKTLENTAIQGSPEYTKLIKILAAFPMGCTSHTIQTFGLTDIFNSFPVIARRDLLVNVGEGYTLRALAQEDIAQEQIEQRLTREFANTFSHGKNDAIKAATAWIQQVLLSQGFLGGTWKKIPTESRGNAVVLQGDIDQNYPERKIALKSEVAAIPAAPIWQSFSETADIEMIFQLCYGLEPSILNYVLVSPECPDKVIYQFNGNMTSAEDAEKILPKFLFEYYAPERWSVLQTLSLIGYLNENKGDAPNEQRRIENIIQPLRQYVLTLLLGQNIQIPAEFANDMAGSERIKFIMRRQFQLLYPTYKTIISGSKWKESLQFYQQAIEKLAAHEKLSVARGRQPWNTTKSEAVTYFGIPGHRITNLEPTLNALKMLISIEEYSGRQADSEIRLRILMHPLEEEWLRTLESSKKFLDFHGQQVQSVKLDDLFAIGRQQGYSADENVQLFVILQKRKFIALDPSNKYVLRNIEAMDDLIAVITETLNTQEKQVNDLAHAFVDLDTSQYAIGKQRTMLKEAKERDQIEEIRDILRQYNSKLQEFSARQIERLVISTRDLLADLHTSWNIGIPQWLAVGFGKSPLQSQLESQRVDIENLYGKLLSKMVETRKTYMKYTNFHGAKVEDAITLSQAKQSLKKEHSSIKRELENLSAQRERFEAWRIIIESAQTLEREILKLQENFGESDILPKLVIFWETYKDRFSREPRTTLESYGDAQANIQQIKSQTSAWLENHRKGFEDLCQTYRHMLAQCGIRVDLRIPYDRDQPVQSHELLFTEVERSLIRHIDNVQSRIKSAQRKVRYSKSIEGHSFDTLEAQIQSTAHIGDELKRKLDPTTVRNHEKLNTEYIPVLQQIIAGLQLLEDELKKLLRKKPAEGRETKLLERLQAGKTQEIDLRGFLLQLLDNNEEFNLNAIIQDAEALFQKNLIDIRISLQNSDEITND